MSPPSPPGFTLMPQLSSVLEDGSQNHTVTCDEESLATQTLLLTMH